MRSGIMGDHDNMVSMHDVLDAQVTPGNPESLNPYNLKTLTPKT